LPASHPSTFPVSALLPGEYLIISYFFFYAYKDFFKNPAAGLFYYSFPKKSF
jgi:hypothetical protein